MNGRATRIAVGAVAGGLVAALAARVIVSYGVLGAGMLVAVPVVVLALTNRWLLALACVVGGLAIPTDWLTGAYVGVPWLTLPRVLIAAGVVHVLARPRKTILQLKTRLMLPDVFVVTMFVCALLGLHLTDHSARLQFEYVVATPAMFYFILRVMQLDEKEVVKVAVGAQVAALFAACTVFADAVAGRELFLGPKNMYSATWLGESFRPGGILADPPRMGTALAIVLCLALFALPRVGAIMRCFLLTSIAVGAAGIVLTLTKSVLAAVLVVGFMIAVLHLGPGRAVGVTTLLGAVMGVAYMVLPRAVLERSLLRPETVGLRYDLLGLTLDGLRKFSPMEYLFGAGFLSTRDISFSSAWTLARSGTHDSFLTTFAETGILGLVGFVGFLGAATLMGMKRAFRRGSDSDAGTVLAAVAIILGMTSLGYESIRSYVIMSECLGSATLMIGLMAKRPEAGGLVE